MSETSLGKYKETVFQPYSSLPRPHVIKTANNNGGRARACSVGRRPRPLWYSAPSVHSVPRGRGPKQPKLNIIEFVATVCAISLTLGG